VYYDRIAFSAATTAATSDQFVDLAAYGRPPFPPRFSGSTTRSVGAYTYTVRSTSGHLAIGGLPREFGFPGGSPYLYEGSQDGSLVFSAFTSGVTAVGGSFFHSDVAGYAVPGDTLFVTVQIGSSSLLQTLVRGNPSSFVGFVSHMGPITSLSVRAGRPARCCDWPRAAVSSVWFGGVSTSVVPEPSTWALTLTGLAGLGAFVRRRRRASDMELHA
jgi:hypothetical protein